MLALAAPAWAGSDAAPGQQKKQDVVPQAPAAAPQTPATPAPQSQAKAPVTRGTVKKPARATQPATTVAPKARNVATRRSAARAHQPAAASRVRATRPSTHAAGVRVHRRASSPPERNRRAAAPTAAPSPAGATEPAPVARTGHVQPRSGSARLVATNHEAPLASISRAADHVVEVIPGTVVLALAGLVTLVLLLIVRALSAERRQRKQLVTSYGVTVESLAVAIEAKDHTTGGHIERVRRLGLLLANEIVPREARDPQMAYGFLLHDIGKLAVPDAILRAPGRLTEEQWALMRRHPEEGVRMLGGVPFLDRALEVVRHHHERWDGGGYPDGLHADEIPLWARIFSVVDALDAMTAERPYRPPRSYGDALAEIREHAGTQFDPAVVEALERLEAAVVEPLLEPTQQSQSPPQQPPSGLPAVAPPVAA
jgi:ribonuclease P protein subunit RPR2